MTGSWAKRIRCWHILLKVFSSVQFSSVAQSCPTLCNPMNRSTPGLPVHHQLLEFTQTHVHQGSDAIQPPHPLSSPSPPAPSPSQHQGLFQWVNSSHEVAKVLEFQLQHQSFQRTPRTDLLYDGLVGSPCSPRDSQESSPTPQFKSITSLAFSFLSPALTLLYNICYQFCTFKIPIFSTYFYLGVWLLPLLLSPLFDSPFSPTGHLYLLPPPSLLNPILNLCGYSRLWITLREQSTA